MQPNLIIEEQYTGKTVAGIDEVGVGALAGPVVAAAVIVNKHNIISGIKDSKKLQPKTRLDLYHKIIKHYYYSLAILSSKEIDLLGIRKAVISACILAGKKLSLQPDIILVDGNMKFPDPRYISIIKGDSLSLSIAASSIIAKVTRDHIMQSLDEDFPQYYWGTNMGYGTVKHIEAIKAFGLSLHHRKSFKVNSK